MLTKLGHLRVNFVIVIAGPVLIILLIKMISSLLPAQYYFNFSKLVAGSSEPFIVDPPAMTGSRLCEVMTRYAIPKDTFGRPLSCGDDFESTPISADELDKIYSTALRSDQAIRKAFVDVATKTGLRQMTDAEIKQVALKSSSVSQAFETIFDTYAEQLRAIAYDGPSRAIQALYDDLSAERRKSDVGDDRPDVAASPGLSEELSRQIVAAHQSLRVDLTGLALAQKISPIKKSSIDQIVRRAQAGGGDVGPGVTGYYANALVTALRESMSRGFSSFGLTAGKTVDHKVIFGEIVSFSWRSYVLSILLRLTPVFLFGLCVGFAAGRSELLSIALAGGLAAFLLSWPLILMWDRLVQSSWASKQPLFFAFYAVYVVSFFLTARSAAVLGVWLREQRVPIIGAQPIHDPDMGVRVTWRELVVNVAGALVLNVAVYAWNIFIPLSATAPQ